MFQENPNHLPLTERIPKPSEGSFTRLNQRKFPMLSVNAVHMFMEENKSMSERERPPKVMKQPRKPVPKGTKPSKLKDLKAVPKYIGKCSFARKQYKL